ncbi:hypothetical protein ACWEF6_11030 [Amycolatopsis sp. NPDC004772]
MGDDWSNGTSTKPGTGPGRGGGRPDTGTGTGHGGSRAGGPPAIDYRAAGQAAVKHNPLPIPKAATQPVYGNNGGIKPPVSSSPNLPASSVAQTVVGDPNTQKITQAVTGQEPVVRTVGQAPVSELAPSGPVQAPGFEEQVTGLLNLIPFSGLSVAWRLVTADSWADAGHQLLDLVGYIPIAGEVADGANALWYLGEGDGLNAGLSAAAAVPFVGWAAAAGKMGKQAVKSLEEAAADLPKSAGKPVVNTVPRRPGGKFAPRDGAPGQDGALDERTVLDQLQLDGAPIISGQVPASVPGFPLRKYDGAVELNGKWYGVETKGEAHR